MPRGFYVTTPIYYISGTPHIGHAYTTIAADVLARYHRTLGPTFFLTGTDEHGQKVAAAAAAAGVTPETWCDGLVDRWRALSRAYDATNDVFIRTTEPRHREVVLRAFERLRASGDVYLGRYEGWYCTNDETFWLESKLVDGRCPNPECGRDVQWVSEENWFFALSRYRDRLLEHFRARPRFVRPERAMNEMLATLEGGLDDLCISRPNVSWGVPIPGGGTIYVWLDALLNYLTALDWPDGPMVAEFWPADVQLIGKEIARFHTLVWPAVLWALGLPAPETVFAHGWLTFDGEKISKSKGNAVDPFELVEEFGVDAIRYYLLREAPFGSDFSFGTEKVRQRYNGELGNGLGNLLKRTLAMVEKYRGGVVPSPGAPTFGAAFAELPTLAGSRLADLDFRGALDAIFEFVAALNGTIAERKPWELAKTGDDDALDAVLYDACEGLRWIGTLLAPFLPRSAAAIRAQLGDTAEPGAFASLRWGGLVPGTRTLPEAAPLFPRKDEPVPVSP